MIRRCRPGVAFFFGFLILPASLSCVQKNPKDLKAVHRSTWSFEGGTFFATDGRIPNGPCFRLTGQATAPKFFDDLRRIDDENGTQYMRGTETVTEFPARLDVQILIHDQPCSFLLKDKTTEPPLAKDDITKLRLLLFWKHGVAMRPTQRIVDGELNIRELQPNITPEANDLAPRYEWHFSFGVPSEGVAIEDSLVVTFQTRTGEIAARTSARL